jgi:predicted ATPase
MRYLQIQVKGYKALADVTLDLHPLTVMIGPNGCGKTSLLEVFHLFREGATGQLATAITSLGGFNNIVSQMPKMSSRLEFVLKASDLLQGVDSIAYTFVLEPRALGYVVALEHLQLHRLNNDMPYPEFQENNVGPELMLAQSFLQVAAAEPKLLREVMSKTVSLAFVDVDTRAPIRLPQSLVPVAQPGRNGETLFAALYNLRESKDFHSYYERIEETLHLAFPDFEYLELPVVGAGQITLAWHQKDLTVPLYPNQLSEGTLRFLWLTTVLLSPEPPPLILIDEPEVSLHPELLQILAALLRDASARTQLIVATHSSDLIRWLQPDEVVVIDKQDGKSTFTWADDPALDLEKWLQEYTLADLWYMGNLGGRP